MNQREHAFTLLLPFRSSQALKGLGDAHARWGGPSAFLNSAIQMLTPSRNTPPDNLEIIFYQLGLGIP